MQELLFKKIFYRLGNNSQRKCEGRTVWKLETSHRGRHDINKNRVFTIAVESKGNSSNLEQVNGEEQFLHFEKAWYTQTISSRLVT